MRPESIAPPVMNSLWMLTLLYEQFALFMVGVVSLTIWLMASAQPSSTVRRERKLQSSLLIQRHSQKQVLLSPLVETLTIATAL